MEAFPSYGDIAQREERFLCFMVHLCLKQGATDLEELLAIADGGKTPGRLLQADCFVHVANTKKYLLTQRMRYSIK